MATKTISKLRSKPETARILGISIATLDRRIEAGEIEYFKIGWRVLFDDAQIEAYKERCLNAPRIAHRKRDEKPRTRNGAKRYAA